MGSFNTVCSVSRQIVQGGDKVRLIPVAGKHCISAFPLTAVYDDYGEFDIDDNLALECLMKNVSMFNDGVSKENLAHGFYPYDENRWTIPDLWSKTKYETSFIVVKSDVYDLVSEFGITCWWEKPVYDVSDADDWLPVTPERVARHLKTLQERLKELIEDSEDPEDDILVNHVKIMIDNVHIGNAKHYELSRLIKTQDQINDYAHHDDTTYAIFKNIEEFAKLENFYAGCNNLDIVLTSQEYGRQTCKQFEKVRMMTKIQIAGFNQTEKIQLTPVEWDVKIPYSMVVESTKPNWSNEVDLIRVGDCLEITDSKYNEFKEYKHDDVYLSEK
ncbi:hypothetical protein [Aeromonas phage AS-zj]|uniref:Uncharacterized protein n=1 Tax=Aeromonas phage AS-zj TaxID=2024208 RepID=A0A223LCQ5_9CAUD|nr:hypothetical protein HWB28_gp342 [Aeromonas phage AS-zj]ASU00210.1 hypothetical protein [Aeromonas phage AS-zj]QAX99122.1 hypothetical protein assk_337 [Aeromonas phage Assk]